MISPIRLQIDLLVQTILIVACAILTIYFPFWAFVCLFAVAIWQLISATELWLSFRLHTRHSFLWAGMICLIVGFLGNDHFGIIIWLPLLTVVLVHLWRTAYEYQLIRRRRRTFWDV